MLNLDLARRDGGAGWCGKTRLGIRRHGENDVARIAADGEHSSRVRPHRYADVAENLADLVELGEVDHGSGRGGRVDDDVVAAALRYQCDGQDFDPDRGPVLGGRVAQYERKVGALRGR